MTRRDFIKSAALLTAGIFLPNVTEAARKKIIVPKVSEFKTLNELEINSYPLDFGEMSNRTHTGAIVIHHAGMSRDKDMTVYDIHDFHVNNNHWSGIGYHFVIHKDGIIEHGRPIESVGAHAFLNNEFTVGICLTGNYDLGKPPQEQLYSAVQLVAAICDNYNFPATETTIFGHRDFSGTSCPGRNLYPLLPDIIKNAQEIL